MRFLDRELERQRLDRLCGGEGGLGVVYGRRRIGKTRLLLEWVADTRGVYTVADQSAPEIQRRYFAQAIATRLVGFGDVVYPDWRVLLSRLAQEASRVGFRGPIVLDELPYLVASSPELPSVLQHWIDHEAKQARLVCAVAGSSQGMMQGLVLDPNAPLYGRAKEIIDLQPLPIGYLKQAFALRSAHAALEIFAAWGGVPRYWELALGVRGNLLQRIDRLVLDPQGVLHREPDRLLLEELPPALEVRPVLDAIGAGAHRLVEIAARIGRPATSLSRPLNRLIGLGLAKREIPFGENERGGKRSLYRIDDPFFRLWFRVVAPERAKLAAATPKGRLELLARHWPTLVASAWEDLCRSYVPRAPSTSGVGRSGPYGPASRWWQGEAEEWDVVSESLDGKRLLLGEVKWQAKSVNSKQLEYLASRLASRTPPPAGVTRGRQVVRCLFVPHITSQASSVGGIQIVTAAEVTTESRHASTSRRKIDSG